MAALSDAARQAGARALVNKLVESNWTATMGHDAIKAAFDAIDDWCEANAASFNNALPTTFKNTATQPQKAMMLAYVAMKKGGLI